MADVAMPRLSDSMEEGTILRWLKSDGDPVSTGDELVEIETDKANMVYEADTAGTLIEIIADENDTLPIGEVIARIGDASEADMRQVARRFEQFRAVFAAQFPAAGATAQVPVHVKGGEVHIEITPKPAPTLAGKVTFPSPAERPRFPLFVSIEDEY